MLTLNNLKNAAKPLSDEELVEQLNEKLKASGPKGNSGQYNSIKAIVARNREAVKAILGFKPGEYLQDKKAVWAIIDKYNESVDDE